VLYTVHGRGRFVNAGKARNDVHPALAARKTIGILGEALSNRESFYSSFLNRLLERVRSMDGNVKFLQKEFFSGADALKGLNGLVWISPTPGDIPKLEKLVANGVNVVAANKLLCGTNIPYVAIEQESASERLSTRMLLAGHSKIACLLLHCRLKYAEQRLNGVMNAFKKQGLKYDESLLCELSASDENESEREKEVADFFESHPDVTAVYMMGERLHSVTLNALKKAKKRIPSDISVAAFDEVPHANDGGLVFSCAKQPLETMADSVLEILMSSHKNKAALSRLLFPILIEGETIRPLE
jgi:DNA-binding LacI/PurR family transcriptional regulator